MNILCSTAPQISIIVAVYNGAKTLQHCIDSIAGQTYKNIELIVIDGGSSDATVEIIESNHGKIASWVSEPDRGVYSAWNKGLLRSHGEWICFLGADDFFWDSHVLEQMADSLSKTPSDVRLVYGRVMLLDHDDAPLYSIGEPWDVVKERFRQIMCIPHPGLLHRQSLFKQLGPFDESFKIAGDYELMLRELMHANANFVPNIITVGMRQGGISSSPANAIESLREIRQAQKINGIRFPGRRWMTAILRVYLRLLLWQLVGEKRARKLFDMARQMVGLPPYWTKT